MNNERFTSIQSELSNPLDSSIVKTRNQGGTEVSYVPWSVIVGQLNNIAGAWSYRFVGQPFMYRTTRNNVNTDHVSVEVEITIEGVTRAAKGEEILTEFSGYGDPISNASSMALRRAAAMFGFGLELWNKPASGSASPARAAGPRPVAANRPPAQPGVVIAPFGRSKGKPISDISDDDLNWLIGAVSGSVEDPSKANFRAKNEDLLAALDNERLDRDGGELPE